ncbi:hypothetical protein [Halonatronum saccharophilum]|uniref:hypothetical protein n=1 Tax=Halonatronum saccharophilum TaxID=150060 RepID=UPI00047FDE96|nr:hypothetical protein [Halonatronum saccharophilum]
MLGLGYDEEKLLQFLRGEEGSKIENLKVGDRELEVQITRNTITIGESGEKKIRQVVDKTLKLEKLALSVTEKEVVAPSSLADAKGAIGSSSGLKGKVSLLSDSRATLKGDIVHKGIELGEKINDSFY